MQETNNSNMPNNDNRPSNDTKPSKDDNLDNSNQAAITKLQKLLKVAWLLWLLYRGVIFAVLLNVLLSTSPNITGGIAWQIMLLIPALILTPWMIKGKSPYALLLGSMITLVYLGSSGVMLFTIFYSSGISVWWVYALDTLLLLMINVWMFKLLKVLPSMNNVEKKPRR